MNRPDLLVSPHAEAGGSRSRLGRDSFLAGTTGELLDRKMGKSGFSVIQPNGELWISGGTVHIFLILVKLLRQVPRRAAEPVRNVTDNRGSRNQFGRRHTGSHGTNPPS